MLRSFTIQDFGLLKKYQQQILFLHNQPLLTRGPASFSQAAWLSPLTSLAGIFTYVSDANGSGERLIAQLQHNIGSPLACCRFLAPRDSMRGSALVEVIEALLARIGERGAQSLVAEIAEDDPALALLRQAGFGIYARQHIWRIDSTPTSSKEDPTSSWRPSLSSDQLAIHLLRNSLLPGQVQQIESQDPSAAGFVYYRDGQLLAYAEVARGPQGVYVQPFVHLDADPIDAAFAGLIAKLHPRRSRPVYVCLRSYQDWLEGSLRHLGADPGPYQASLVRRTVKPLKVENKQRIPVANRSVEPTMTIHAPIVTQRHEPEWMIHDQTPNYR